MSILKAITRGVLYAGFWFFFDAIDPKVEQYGHPVPGFVAIPIALILITSVLILLPIWLPILLLYKWTPNNLGP